MIKEYTYEKLKESIESYEDLDLEKIHEQMESWDAKQWAVFLYFSEDLELVEDITELDIDTDEVRINGEDILVLTDVEAEDRWDKELDCYIDDVIYPEIPEYLRNYFDEEAWKRDAMFDGRGQAIARYDGNENEFMIEYDNGFQDWIYIYRV